MLDTWYKVAGIVIAGVMLVSLLAGPGLTGLVWLVQLDADVEQLQEDMSEVQVDIENLRAGQQEILTLLRALTHNTGDLQSDFE